MRALYYSKGNLIAIEFDRCKQINKLENHYLMLETPKMNPERILFNFGRGSTADRNINIAIMNAVESYVDLTNFNVSDPEIYYEVY